MYGFKASFFIACNFVGKSAKQMNFSSIVNFAGKGVKQMTWNDITTLFKQGYQIGAHTMNHLRNMTNIPNSELDYEIGRSKQCILDHGIPVTVVDKICCQVLGCYGHCATVVEYRKGLSSLSSCNGSPVTDMRTLMVSRTVLTPDPSPV